MSKTLNMVGGGGGGLYASIFATGVSQSDTVTLTTPSGKVKSGKWTSKPNPASHGLPSAYQEVAFLKSTGTQYINTGVKITNASYLRVKTKVMFDTLDGTWNQVFGSGYAYDNNAFDIFVGTDNQLRSHMANMYSNTFGEISAGTWYELDIEVNKGVGNVTLNGAAVSISRQPVSTFSVKDALTIFAGYDGSTLMYGRATLKDLEMYLSKDHLDHQYISCREKSTGEYGTYDLVTNSFKPNVGSGTFEAGPDVPASVGGYLFENLGEFGTYTLTANNGEKTVSETVLVDVVADYQIEIEYSGGA